MISFLTKIHLYENPQSQDIYFKMINKTIPVVYGHGTFANITK